GRHQRTGTPRNPQAERAQRQNEIRLRHDRRIPPPPKPQRADLHRMQSRDGAIQGTQRTAAESRAESHGRRTKPLTAADLAAQQTIPRCKEALELMTRLQRMHKHDAHTTRMLYFKWRTLEKAIEEHPELWVGAS